MTTGNINISFLYYRFVHETFENIWYQSSLWKDRSADVVISSPPNSHIYRYSGARCRKSWNRVWRMFRRGRRWTFHSRRFWDSCLASQGWRFYPRYRCRSCCNLKSDTEKYTTLVTCIWVILICYIWYLSDTHLIFDILEIFTWYLLSE